MASENTANELPANTTVSFAGDVLAARIAPLVFAAMVALIGMLTITGVFSDFRDAIDPKHPEPDPDFEPRPYYQVFQARHGFIPNLSVLDLLFNMGPEGIFWLL